MYILVGKMEQEQNSQDLESGARTRESILRRIGRQTARYVPWVVGGTAAGGVIGYEISDNFVPAGVTGPYYLEQVVQNFVYSYRGAIAGAGLGGLAKFIKDNYPAIMEYLETGEINISWLKSFARSSIREIIPDEVD